MGQVNASQKYSKNLTQEVHFMINGKPHKITNNIPVNTSLNTYIRDLIHLKGTKSMCNEGGCGACVVAVQPIHPNSKKQLAYSINSCLVPVLACHGLSITTIEGVGSRKTSYHEIQKRLAAASGTQCGYCSPGMVMTMYCLLLANPRATMAEIENNFGGNICRCTGYRPILDAFKSMAHDAPDELVNKLTDIEDMIFPTCKSNCGQCTNICKFSKTSIKIEVLGASWYRPSNIKEIMEIMDIVEGKSFRFVGGNTGQGLFRIKADPEIYVDLNGIPELHESSVRGNEITLGANINMTEAMEFFLKLAKDQPVKYGYCKTLADHIDLIANPHIGTFAGNLSLKHQNNAFPSDLFLLLEIVKSKILLSDKSGVSKKVSLAEFLKTDMRKKLIAKIYLPAQNSSYITASFKIMPVAQNSVAYVNAGFAFQVNKKNNYVVLEKPSMVFGGINSIFVHATSTESYLIGKNLLDNKVLKEAFGKLKNEIKPDQDKRKFKAGLALSLFYKFILSIDPKKVNERNRSGGSMLQRPVSSGKQEFETDRKIWPLNKPVPKLEALIQCAGEAEYTNDIPIVARQLWGQMVLSDRGPATISKIDASEALKMPGVVAFYSAKDIPGKNSFTPPNFLIFEDEPVFANGGVAYAGQAIGVVIADSNETATRAAGKVKIAYSRSKKPIINVKQIVDQKMTNRIKEYVNIKPKSTKSGTKHVIKGQWHLKAQYHYPMETPSCLAVPVDDKLEVDLTTQYIAYAQAAISQALNIQEHRIVLRVRRLGGAYGSKLTRANHIGVVCSLAAYLLQQPVRMTLSMESNVKWSGKRFPVLSDYDVGVDENGQVQYLSVDVYQDDGHCPNDSAIRVTMLHIKNVYDASVWSLKGYGVKTDTASNTYCRAPGATEAISIIETIMEHIVRVVKKDPTSVRLANVIGENNKIIQMIEVVKKTSDYQKRSKEIESFNEKNRWKKKGISLVPMSYPIYYYKTFHAMVSIYGEDGTVTITHGAVEMGQGVNTKAAQVAAHALGIDLEMVNVAPTTNLNSPNDMATALSMGSESVCYAVLQCCKVVNERLEPVKKDIGAKANWKQIINMAVKKNINLNSSYMFSPSDAKGYDVFGVAVTEVEVDILTGQFHVKRVDIVEDAGQSISPEVDIGQVEGAFVMGLGYYTSEEIISDANTGAVLTNRTWNYKPPGAKDIPIDFRISLLKNSSNPFGVLRSKATGEPPLCLSCSVTFAIRNAIKSARKDAGQIEEWFDIEPPFTVERIWLSALTKEEMFTI